MGSLRLTLALLVVYFHAGSPLGTAFVPDGRAAVQMFFLISGFYMTLVLNEKYRTAETNWLFYSNRFFRLWPAAFVVNLLVILSFVMMDEVRLFMLTMGIADFLAFLGSLDPWSLTLVIVTNLTVVGQDLLWFLRFDPTGTTYLPFGEPGHNGASLSLNHPLFTVAIEAFYYLISPFVLRRGWRVALGFVMAGGAYHVALFALGLSPLTWGYHFFGGAAYFYFFGACAYHIYRLLGQEPLRAWVEARQPLAWALVLGGLVLLLPIDWLMPRSTLFMVPIFALIVPVLFILTRYRQLDRMIGELSFGVYLVHYPILMVIQPALDPVGLWFATTVLSVAAALLLFWLLEQPIDRWRQRRAAAAVDRSGPERSGGLPRPSRAAAGKS